MFCIAAVQHASCNHGVTALTCDCPEAGGACAALCRAVYSLSQWTYLSSLLMHSKQPRLRNRKLTYGAF